MYLAFKKSKKHDGRDLQQYFSTFLFLEYDESNTEKKYMYKYMYTAPMHLLYMCYR